MSAFLNYRDETAKKYYPSNYRPISFGPGIGLLRSAMANSLVGSTIPGGFGNEDLDQFTFGASENHQCAKPLHWNAND